MQLPVRKRAALLRPLEPDSLVLTPEAISDLRREEARLRRAEPDAIAEVRRTVQMGDLSENAAYQIAKSRLRGLQSRLLVIADRLARASVLVPPTDGCIGLGSTVTLRASTGSEQVWQVVSRMEVDIARGRISDESVVGKALMGKREGEEVAWETPKGIARSTVVRVE